ncbi:MAG: ABC transporter permease [Gammaproteobacteria bacterium]|nr:MAG: ABC transporter permease [Gammaproteobacteria bacterium]
MVWHLAAHELRRLFLSPMAWAVLAVEQLLLAYFFLVDLDNYLAMQPQLATMPGAPGVTDLVVAPLFGDAALLALFAVPVMTMRLLAEERRAQTLRLLVSAPVAVRHIVLGKYLGVTLFFLILVALAALMPLSLLVGGSLDFGMYAAGLLGVSLLVAAFCAVGLYLSSLTAQPAIAAVATFGVLLLLWILDWAGPARDGGGVLGYLSLLSHYQPLLRGVFDSADVAYYLLVILTFLALAVRRLDAQRLQP